MDSSIQCQDIIYSNEYLDLILKAQTSEDTIAQIFNPVCRQNLDHQFIIIQVNAPNVTQDAFTRYEYTTFPNCFGLLDMSALESAGVIRLQNIPGFSLRGQGTLVGIIDTGVDYTLPLLRYGDGTTKIVSIWDQTIPHTESNGTLLYGTEYTESQINEALQSEDPFSIVPSTDNMNHGTPLVSLIVGNRDEANGFSGVVPDAKLVVVKLKEAKKNIRDLYLIPDEVPCYQENDIMLGIQYLIAVANRQKKPIAICIALGTTQGAHDGRDSLSQYINYKGIQNGIAVISAAGNEGNRRHHYYGVINKLPGFDTIEINVGQEEKGFSLELWGSTPGIFSIDITSPSGEYIPKIPARLGESRVFRFLFEDTVIYVNYYLVESDTGDPFIFIRLSNPSTGIWRFNVYGEGDLLLDFHSWLPLTGFITPETYFLRPNPDTTLTSPSNAIVPVTITAYNHHDDSLFIDASKGFNRFNYPKPDVAAPGVGIIVPSSQTSYTTYTGSSIAAAIGTGTAAMILEWGIVRGNLPNTDSIEVKNFLIRGARRDPLQSYPNQRWGFGILDIFRTFESFR